MAMLEGDELAIHVASKPEGVKVFEIGCTWVTCNDGEHVYWIACRFKGIKAGETHSIITRMIRDRDGSALRLTNDLTCTEDAPEYTTFILESRLGYWRTE